MTAKTTGPVHSEKLVSTDSLTRGRPEDWKWSRISDQAPTKTQSLNAKLGSI
jgi:hypothetical protein